jgi:hypothetical protein
MDLREIRCEMWCGGGLPDFGISGVEHSGSATTVSVTIAGECSTHGGFWSEGKRPHGGPRNGS